MLQWYQIVRHWWISNFFKRNHISKERNIQYFLFLCSGSSPVPSSRAKTDRQNCSIIQYCFCLQSISYSKNIFLKAAFFSELFGWELHTNMEGHSIQRHYINQLGWSKNWIWYCRGTCFLIKLIFSTNLYSSKLY